MALFVLPIGLESKFKIIPIATLIIGFVTIVFSINNFSFLSDFESKAYRSPLSKDYADNVRTYVYESCIKDKKNFCNDINKLPDKLFIRIVNAVFFKQDFKNKKFYSLMYIQEKLRPENLQASNKKIYQQQQDVKKSIQNYINSKSLLNKENITFVSLLKSLILHDGFLHLFGNMLLFLFLAPYVEARIGALGLFASYLFTGMVASGFDVFLNQDLKLLVGASSAVSGVMGIYATLFWKHQTKFVVSNFLMFTKKVFVPVYFCIPVLYVAGDLIGLVKANDNIGYVAHLVGFVLGISLGLGFKKFYPLPKGFVFLYEKDYFKQVKNTNWALGKFNIYKKWINDSPKNLFVFRQIVELKNQLETSYNHEKNFISFLNQDLNTIYILNKLDPEFINLCPLSWLAYLKGNEDPLYLIKIFQNYEACKNHYMAIKYNYLILKNLNWKDQEWIAKFANLYLSHKESEYLYREFNKLVDIDINVRKCLEEQDEKTKPA